MSSNCPLCKGFELVDVPFEPIGPIGKPIESEIVPCWQCVAGAKKPERIEYWKESRWREYSVHTSHV